MGQRTDPPAEGLVPDRALNGISHQLAQTCVCHARSKRTLSYAWCRSQSSLDGQRAHVHLAKKKNQ